MASLGHNELMFPEEHAKCQNGRWVPVKSHDISKGSHSPPKMANSDQVNVSILTMALRGTPGGTVASNFKSLTKHQGSFVNS